MLSKYDDYPIHQTDRELTEIGSQDPNWEEAVYFNIHDRSGEFSAVCGLDVFPNAQYVAGWLSVLHDGEHFLVEKYAIATSPGLTLTDLPANFFCNSTRPN